MIDFARRVLRAYRNANAYETLGREVVKALQERDHVVVTLDNSDPSHWTATILAKDVNAESAEA